MECEPLLKVLMKVWSEATRLRFDLTICAVVPNAGVPPAEVLQRLVPEESLAVLEEWTAQNYSAKKTELKDLKKTRTENLDGTNKNPDLTNFVRRKREDANLDWHLNQSPLEVLRLHLLLDPNPNPAKRLKI